MNPRVISGSLEGKGLRIALVVSRFNDFIVERLTQGALDALERHGVAEKDVLVARVPGALEIPLAALAIGRTRKHDAIVALGCVIRGETSHYDQVCEEVARGVARAGLDTGVPVTFGVVTAENLEQAIDRAGAKGGNRGWDAAVAAIEMAALLKGLAS
ncbi:MAG TPA: 6,7-dimethyl-8-ribityllumazine synthase [Candidatus Polarisedimenticolia bacterium]|nr:6,7-dimethyl-8-ribityllumazine synthase [Candidatus Polarisedimenticolia bacterium]